MMAIFRGSGLKFDRIPKRARLAAIVMSSDDRSFSLKIPTVRLRLGRHVMPVVTGSGYIRIDLQL
jgi:hypothetical protein